MTRKPKISPPPVELRTDPNIIQQKRRYRLITPLYGGGVEPNKADPISVVRGSEVRGHLRFWWRATQLGRFSTLDLLREGESLLWGSDKRPSEVNITIANFSFGRVEHAYTIERKGKKSKPIPSKYIAPYAAFPLQPEKSQLKDQTWTSECILIDVEFDLHISYPKKYNEQMQDCFWAWETFGGIGARTRRGFGSLLCVKISGDESGNESGNEEEQPVVKNFRNWITNGLEKHVNEVKKPIAGVPYLSRNPEDYIFIPSSDDHYSCWKQLIRLFQDFRQDKARHNNRFGLSQWPEANAIRELHGKKPKFPEGGNQGRTVNKFPRAKFGLPIIFHMPHDRNIPDGITLQGEKVDPENDGWINRLASPIILKPVACANGGCVGLVALFQWQPEDSESDTYAPPGGLYLKGAPNTPRVYSDLDDDEINQIPIISEKDILKEFYEFLKKNGGK